MLLNRSLLAARRTVAAGGYGPNLAENGTFTGDDTTGWTIAAGSTVTGEKLVINNSTGITRTNIYTFPAGLDEGATYLVEFDVSDFSAATGVSRNITLGGTVYTWATGDVANGHFSQSIVAGATETLGIQNRNGDIYNLDTFLVRKVL